MTLAIFSDIHGNIFSLEKALTMMQVFKPEKYLFLGDMAGYYYYQNESIQLLSTLDNLISIKGNHDKYFLESLKNIETLKTLDNKYGKSYSLLHRNLTKESRVFFNTLQECEKTTNYEAYHGSPNNFTEEYIYPNTNLHFDTKVPFIFLGHTHYPMERTIGDTIIINPGSIGQPRDFNQGSFMIVDVKNKKIEHIRYKYDRSKLEKKIILLKDKPYLLSVLQREKNENI